MQCTKTMALLYNYDDIKEIVVQILNNEELMVIPLNSKSFVCRNSSDPNALDLSKGFNIVVGGNTINVVRAVSICLTTINIEADKAVFHQILPLTRSCPAL